MKFFMILQIIVLPIKPIALACTAGLAESRKNTTNQECCAINSKIRGPKKLFSLLAFDAQCAKYSTVDNSLMKIN